MGYPVSKPPPPPRREEPIEPWRREDESTSLEDEWNAKQDQANYFWKVAAAIVIAVAIAVAIL